MEEKLGLFETKQPKRNWFLRIVQFFQQLSFILFGVIMRTIQIGKLPFKLVRSTSDKDKNHCDAIGYVSPDHTIIQQPIDSKFYFPTAVSCLNAIVIAYSQHCTKTIVNPPTVTNSIPLYWYEGREPDALCGFIGIATNEKNGEKFLILAIRGTETGPEWVNDLSYLPVQLGFGDTNTTGKVASGFWYAYNKTRKSKPPLQAQIKSAIIALVEKEPKIKEILITGHSLGAAVATIAAVDLELSFPSLRVIAYTVASPRVGDPEFVRQVLKLNQSRDDDKQLVIWRLYNTSDVVTEVPFSIMIGGIQYQHLASSANHENGIGGWGIDINQDSILSNHLPKAYYDGLKVFPEKKGDILPCNCNKKD